MFGVNDEHRSVRNHIVAILQRSVVGVDRVVVVAGLRSLVTTPIE